MIIMGEKKKFIRDSVYGDISLNKFEQKVLDMPQFQRLRRIKQLGLINLIYPGANHTRFEHSIGTMNLGSKLANELELSEDEIELVRISALLHDVGHGPFSHVSEGVLSFPHEELTKYVISKTSMRDYLEEKFDINSIIKKPLVVSENLETLELLKEFKENKEYVHMALAVDEFGSVEGLITLNDLLEGIVGDIPGIDETDDPMATQRLDGTWLIDGRFQIDKFKELFDYEKEFPYEKEDQYTTIAGFILSLSGKIPDEKEIYDWDRFHFEILDIDGHQIDKILVTDLGPQEEETEEVEE